MRSTDVIWRLHQHRIWVNRQLLAAARPLATQQLHQEFSIGQGTVWKTLVHLHAAEFVWLEALLGNQDPLLPGDARGFLPGNQKGDGGIASFDELQSNWHSLDDRWMAFLSELDDQRLDETVYKVSTSSGFGTVHGTKCADVLLHVCTHAQYTTAQLVNMLRQLGQQQLPDAMLISLSRQEASD